MPGMCTCTCSRKDGGRGEGGEEQVVRWSEEATDGPEDRKEHWCPHWEAGDTAKSQDRA